MALNIVLKLIEMVQTNINHVVLKASVLYDVLILKFYREI